MKQGRRKHGEARNSDIDLRDGPFNGDCVQKLLLSLSRSEELFMLSDENLDIL